MKKSILILAAAVLMCFVAAGQTNHWATNYIQVSGIRFLNPTNPVDAAQIKADKLNSPIWICYEWDGGIYMQGMHKFVESGFRMDSDGTPNGSFMSHADVMREFGVRVESYPENQLFMDRVTTNVEFFTNYTGTIQVGTNDCYFTIEELNAFEWQRKFADLHHLDVQIAYLEGAQTALRLASQKVKTNFFADGEIETNLLLKLP